MKEKFLKNFAIIGSGTFVSMLIGFLTTPLITRIVGPNEYGQYSVFLLYANVALMILYLGLDQSLIRYFYEEVSDSYRRALLYKCLKIPLVLGGVISVIIILCLILDVWRFELGNVALVLLCFYTFIQIIYRFSLLIVRLQYKTKLYSILGSIQKIIYILVALPLVWFGAMGSVISLAFAATLSVFVCMLITIASEKRLWKFQKVKINDCSISNKVLLLYAYPYILSMGVTTIFQAADKIALNIYGTYTDVGIYSSTMTLVHVFSIVQTSFNALWAPMSVEHFSRNQTDKQFYQRGNQTITVMMFFIGITLIFCKDIFVLLLGEKYRQASYILPFLIFNPIMYTISETTVGGLVFMKKSNMQVVVAIVACISNILGNVILVPIYRCQGAAISTGISYIIFFTMRTVLSNRYFYIDFKLKKFYLLTVLVVIYAFYNTFVSFNWITVIGYIVCLFILYVLYEETIRWGVHYGVDIIKKNVWNR